MATADKQKLVNGILDFLQTSLKDGTVKEDDKEGLEVAMQCIGEAFGVELDDPTHSIKPMSLMTIFKTYLNTMEKRGGASAASTSAAAAAGPSASTSSAPNAPTAEDKRAADALKTKGNQLMAQKKYQEAISSYTAAIDLDNTTPVYYSNRAAAYSHAGEHAKAIDDAKKAAEVDPTFSKAYSRMGHALFSSGRYQEAVEAYEKGLELEPANATMKSSLATARARANAAADEDDEEEADAAAPTGAGGGMPDLSALLGGMGGGAGRGGMPDLASMMNNPQMMAMAQSLMANGGMDRIMSNPAVRQMAESFGRGGGMPSMDQLSQLYQDPEMRRMAEQFGGAGRGRGQGSGGSNSNMYS